MSLWAPLGQAVVREARRSAWTVPSTSSWHHGDRVRSDTCTPRVETPQRTSRGLYIYVSVEVLPSAVYHLEEVDLTGLPRAARIRNRFSGIGVCGLDLTPLPPPSAVSSAPYPLLARERPHTGLRPVKEASPLSPGSEALRGPLTCPTSDYLLRRNRGKGEKGN